MPKSENFSCIPKEPLIKLDENGVAPIVKYSMPHDTSYTAKSFMPLDIEEKCFKDEHRKEGNIDNYNRFSGKSEKEIAKILHIEFSNFKRKINMANIKNNVSSVSYDKMEAEIALNVNVEPLKIN
ncbi:hypothetical protein [Olleya sp. YS]|uniref:hypothetical protein n=1 Tax=Olleya sp. YS TaxID=3028318 RepID=UPI0024341352|nr:hypothetical protein [Olleya sp. YS]WGD34142.1 hypothetical protein Ollyesu_10180 [Olleya sp. YS]